MTSEMSALEYMDHLEAQVQKLEGALGALVLENQQLRLKNTKLEYDLTAAQEKLCKLSNIFREAPAKPVKPPMEARPEIHTETESQKLDLEDLPLIERYKPLFQEILDITKRGFAVLVRQQDEQARRVTLQRMLRENTTLLVQDIDVRVVSENTHEITIRTKSGGQYVALLQFDDRLPEIRNQVADQIGVVNKHNAAPTASRGES